MSTQIKSQAEWLEGRKQTQYCPWCSGEVSSCPECYGYSKKKLEEQKVEE